MMDAKTANLRSTEIRTATRKGRLDEARSNIQQAIEKAVLMGRGSCVVESSALKLIIDGHAEGSVETLVDELRAAGYLVSRNLGSDRRFEVSWSNPHVTDTAHAPASSSEVGDAPPS